MLSFGEIARHSTFAAEAHFIGNIPTAFHHRRKPTRVLPPIPPHRFMFSKFVPCLQQIAVVTAFDERRKEERPAEAYLDVVACADRFRRQLGVGVGEGAHGDFGKFPAYDFRDFVHEIKVRPRPRAFAPAEFGAVFASASGRAAVVL